MIRLYTMDDCPYCAELKSYLVAESIEFTEINIREEKNKAEFDRLMEVANCDSVPIVIVNKKILVPERSFTTIREGFELTKQILSGKL